jgi:hypothetical protein
MVMIELSHRDEIKPIDGRKTASVACFSSTAAYSTLFTYKRITLLNLSTRLETHQEALIGCHNDTPIKKC